MTRSNAIAAAVLTSALAVAGLLLHHLRGTHAAARVGAPLAAFDVVSASGSETTLDPHRGTIVYNVFATWCPECRDEIAQVERADALLRSHGARVIGIDQGESLEAVRAFAERYGVGYPIYIDRASRSTVLLGARVIPTTVIVKDGIVRRIVPGALHTSEIVGLVRAVDQ